MTPRYRRTTPDGTCAGTIVRRASRLALLLLLFGASRCHAQETPPSELAFSRIRHGWTNYSTAFLATQDTVVEADYATVASGYIPSCDARPVEYAAIFVWNGPTNQAPRFDQFTFEVGIWSGLEAFARSPRRGDLAAFAFAAPTGGSLTVPDALTRGGRPAWLLRFALTDQAAPVTLEHQRSYLVGVSARTDVAAFGELYVPTSPSRGPSDVQAGNFLIGGWRYVAAAGGQTIYSGELATECSIQTVAPQPALAVEPRPEGLQLSWPASAGCYHLEASDALSPSAQWLHLPDPPTEADGTLTVLVPPDGPARWFRLAR